jgi:hypothetical protein
VSDDGGREAADDVAEVIDVEVERVTAEPPPLEHDDAATATAAASTIVRQAPVGEGRRVTPRP